MSRHLELELDHLKRKLLSLSSMVENMVQNAMAAVKDRDEDLAKSVIGGDEEIDLKEVEVEEDCLKILALYQPVAIDLRLVIAVLKMNNDLERIGDLSVNIAERVVFLCRQRPIPAPFDFKKMSQLTMKMLHNSLSALMKVDTKLAYQVCQDDMEVDKINRDMYDAVFRLIKLNPNHVEALIQYLSVSRAMERIADYATNIAEDVIYMVEGNIVRHHPDETHQ